MATKEKKSASDFSQSNEIVNFKCSVDRKGMKKGVVYKVSENVADILEYKELGSKVK